MSTSAELVASFRTLSSASVGQPPRHGLVDRILAAGLTINEERAIPADNGLRLV